MSTFPAARFPNKTHSYEKAYPFSCGRALVLNNSEEWQLIDTGGAIITVLVDIEPSSTEYSKDGFLLVRDKKDYGFLSVDGKWAFSQRYDHALDFSEGVAAVRVGDKYGFINTDGEFVIEPVYKSATFFSEGLAAVDLSDNARESAWGFVDISGNVVIQGEFDYAYPFSDGYAWVVEQNKFGILKNPQLKD